MRGSNILYFMSQGIKYFRTNKYISLAAVGVLAACLYSGGPNGDGERNAVEEFFAAEVLARRVGERSGSVSVWLGDGATAAGLRAFLTGLRQSGDRCLALTETT